MSDSHSVSLLCAALSVLAYLNTLDLEFCFDDNHALLQNQDVTQPENSSWTNLLFNDFWGMPIGDTLSCKSYRPLCVATFRLNYLLHELQPMGYHLVNVLLHGAVCYLYVQLCCVVFSQVWPALIAGLLFAVHPIHTEAVAGVVGRTELLSAVFFLLSIIVYQKSLSTQQSLISRVARMMMSQMFTVLAMLSKEQGITAVGVSCAYDVITVITNQDVKVKRLKKCKYLNSADNNIHPHRSVNEPSICRSEHHPSWHGVVVRCTVMLIFAGIILKLRIAMAGNSPNFYNIGLGAHSLKSPFQRCLNYSHLVFTNLWLLLNPSFLCADWTGNVLTLITTVTDPRNLLTILTFSGLILIGINALKSFNRQLMMSLSLMIIPFLPASNLFFPVGFVVAERVLYLPSMGFCMLVAYGCWRLARSVERYKFIKLILLLLLAVHLLKTISRNRDWYNNETLTTSGLKLTQENAKFFTMLAKVYSKRGDLATGEFLTRSAVSVQPNDPLLKRKLVHNLQAQQRFEEAEVLYGEMIEELTNNGSKLIGKKRLGRLDINVYAEYAHLLLRDSSKLQRAVEMLQKAVLVQPYSAQLLTELGELLLKLNEPLKAVEVLEQATTITDRNPNVFSHLGTAYSWLGQVEMAEIRLKKALQMVPHHYHIMMTLAYVLHQSDTHGQLERAVKMYNEILDHQSNNVHAALQLGDTLTKLGDLEKAVDAYDRASKMGGASKPLYKLAQTHNALGRHSEAKKTLRLLLTKQNNHVEGLKLLSGILKEDGEASSARELEREIKEHQVRNREKCHKLLQEARLQEKRDPEKADLMLENCLKIDPANDKAMVSRGYLIVRNKMASMYMKAKEMFSDVISHDPHNSEAIFGLGLVQQTLGKYEKAENLYTSVIQQNSEHLEALFNLGYLLSKSGRCHDAVRYLSKVIQLRSSFAEAKTLLGRCSREIGRRATDLELGQT